MNEKYNTLEYYNKNANMYFEQTKEGKFQEIYDRFLKEIPLGGYILDFGCGSGRDSKYFLEHGYKVKSIDGSIEMCKIAREYIGQDVECKRFDELNEKDIYDGIWACSSILHVEKENLRDILNKMIEALKPTGTLYASFKKGTGYEIKEGKYYNFITTEELEKIVADMNIKIIDYFETLPTTKRLGTEGTIWVNYIMKKF